jgi:hypothetical protein
MTTWNKQIENRNFLSPIGFKFTLAKFPKIAYFSQSANIPGITNTQPEQSTIYGRSLPMDGFMQFEDFQMTFLVDEDLENYNLVHNWMRALGTPTSHKDRSAYIEFMQTKYNQPGLKEFDLISADATLSVLNSNFNANFNVVFQGLFPTALSALNFNATVDGSDSATATVTFRYLMYEIQNVTDNRRVTKLD